MEAALRILGILIFAWFVQSFGMMALTPIIRRATRKHHDSDLDSENEKRESTIISIVRSLVRFSTYAIASAVILSESGLDIKPLLAGAGVLGLAVGFGAQSLVKDLVSGIFIIAENQYRVGDLVKLNGVSGKVQQITMRITVLRDFDGNLHYIPNGTIELATNSSMQYSGINIIVGVSYDTDIDKAEKVINEVCDKLAADNAWADQIIETPQFRRISEFADSAINLRIIGKVAPSKQFAIAGEIRRRLKKAFEENHIVIPFPQRVIHNKK